MRWPAEALWTARWWWRLEKRQGHGIGTTLLFLALLILLVGLSQRKIPLSEAHTLLLFWISYLFSLFQAIPRPLLERRPEEWRWLHALVSPEGGLAGLWLFAVSIAVGVGLALAAGAAFFWKSAPPLDLTLTTGFTLSVPLLMSAFLTARVNGSYALAAILGFPLLLFPLLWVLFHTRPPLLPLVLVGVAQSILFFALGPYLWKTS